MWRFPNYFKKYIPPANTSSKDSLAQQSHPAPSAILTPSTSVTELKKGPQLPRIHWLRNPIQSKMLNQMPPKAAPAPTFRHTQEGLSWHIFVSPAQERWTRAELRTLGLVTGTKKYLHPSRWQGQPLWRTPPPGELQFRNPNQLPKPDAFWIHPMFVWSPETTCRQLMGTTDFPCISPACNGRAEKKGIGTPHVVVGIGGGKTGMPNTGQYYILTSTLYCKTYKCSPWASDQPSYLKLLPTARQNLCVAVWLIR